jgi:signal peptidase complex subunit 3
VATSKHNSTLSQAIIWDQIIPSNPHLNPNIPRHRSPLYKKNLNVLPTHHERGLIRLRGVKSKYHISDISRKMAGRQNVTLEVGWNIQPWVGALTWTGKRDLFLGNWKALKGGVSEPLGLPELPIKVKVSGGKGTAK